MIKPELVAVPDRIRERWPDIRAAMLEIAGWAEGHSHGYIDGAGTMEDIPRELPDTVPLLPPDVWDLRKVEGIDPERRLYLTDRDFGKEWSGHELEQPATQELTIGTFCVFRLPTHDVKAFNAEYGGELSENERQLVDDDHTIVVYMI